MKQFGVSTVHKDSAWLQVPSWKGVGKKEFNNHLWQERNAVTGLKSLEKVLLDRIDDRFANDVRKGLEISHMELRIPPYIISLIDWDDPYNDPLRKQFLPLESEIEIDHPMLSLDPINEVEDSAVPGLIHRYRDRVLFLTTDVCPVYCKYCTRSYAVGPDTAEVSKLKFNPKIPRWEQGFNYIENNTMVEDVVVSGGDCYRLKGEQIKFIGKRLIDIPHVRRIRFATKGLAVLPMKILSDNEWVAALQEVSNYARLRYKTVSLHTHFNHENEITEITHGALNRLFDIGIKVRNQSVLLKGVNDSAEAIINLNSQLNNLNVQPYYQFLCDMVKGVENLRTSLDCAIDIEKSVRGATAGYNTPKFVVDLAGGGGKRSVHSFEIYNRNLGIGVFKAPNVKKDRLFLYCDPLSSLDKYYQQLWLNPKERRHIIEQVIKDAGGELEKTWDDSIICKQQSQ